ncbi:hypothetical protein 20Sep418_00093 [Pseudomonas phage 20Sep418]|uniref:Uncharacterized protein n=1 Tax=Pseudomonas phage Baskent_P3_3B TaxID=3145033 RepID=A0AAU8BAB7_9CAUD|nr:hypothetical protein 20Sep418_00093 [Pseudomonas phage 20Sep418]
MYRFTTNRRNIEWKIIFKLRLQLVQVANSQLYTKLLSHSE